MRPLAQGRKDHADPTAESTNQYGLNISTKGAKLAKISSFTSHYEQMLFPPVVGFGLNSTRLTKSNCFA